MTVRRCEKFEEDPNQHPAWDIWMANRTLRVWIRQNWCWPYGRYNWGYYGFGMGLIGFMFWPKKNKLREKES